MKTYSGAQASQISFPLGGIGSGSIGIDGTGRLIDWEIFNRPAKGSRNGFSHLAVRAVSKGKLLDARVLAGELPPPYIGSGPEHFSGFGFGPKNLTMAGLPNFRQATFRGETPFAELDFRDRAFPGEVKLTAFNPFIPLNEDDSSLPAAFFEIEFQNPTSSAIAYTAALTVGNPSTLSRNTLRTGARVTLLQLQDDQYGRESARYGDLTIATDATEADGQAYWYRGRWTDGFEVFWHEFASAKPLPRRNYAKPAQRDQATLTATIGVRPRSRGKVRFVLSWNFPNCVNYWTDPPPEGMLPRDGWKNYYATKFSDSAATARYALKHWDRLRKGSEMFRRALHSSTVPAPVLEAISANLATLKSPTVLRLEDGSFYGWEGCHMDAGSCEGTCTHVWNYAYALPFLFPRLERSIRDLNWRYNLTEDDGLTFRLKLPLGSDYAPFRPCCDGQFGDIVKFYRDWKISGDTAWMRSLWPLVKRSLEYAWSPKNNDRWDPDKTGVLQGRQHHTLDMELFGPNSWLTGFYHAALKAAAEMAEAAGDRAGAREYREILERGQKWVRENLFNGRWFIQKIDLADRKLLSPFQGTEEYWNPEYREIKYQIAEGVGIDQVVAQWHANLCGLGRIFEPEQCRSALAAIHRHNFKKSMRGMANTWRLYSLYDEAGVLICTWPKGSRKPVIPIPYNSETMYGFEYAAAALMIQEGLVEEGLEIVRECRRRFEGDRRNPWNEFEAGSNYARSMASYSLLLALSGFEFDATKGLIGFSPKSSATSYRAFWSLDSGWGTVEFSPGRVRLEVLTGSLVLSEFRSDRVAKAKKVLLGRRPVALKKNGLGVQLAKPLKIAAGQTFEIAF